VFAKDNITADYQISSFDEIHLDSSGRIGRPVLVVGRKGAKAISRPTGPVEGSGQACTVVAGGTASFAFSVLILFKVSNGQQQGERVQSGWLTKAEKWLRARDEEGNYKRDQRFRFSVIANESGGADTNSTLAYLNIILQDCRANGHPPTAGVTFPNPR
jgi:hypothetical protein